MKAAARCAVAPRRRRPRVSRQARPALRRLLALALLALATTALPPRAAEASELGAGEWVDRTFRATGRWDGAVLRAESLQLREHAEDGNRVQVTARLAKPDARRRRFGLGPWTVEWNADTRFDRVDVAGLRDGRTLRVSGRLDKGVLRASSIRPSEDAGGDAVQVTALVTAASELGDGEFEFRMGGKPVRTRRAGYNAVESLTRRQDARRPASLLQAEVFGRPFTLTGEYTMQLRDRRNLRLERQRDEVLDSEAEFQLEAWWAPRETLHVFVGAKAVYDAEILRAGGTREPQAALERDQSWVFLDRIGGSNFGLQLGRQNFKETREWWWDDDLDAARLYFDRAGWHAELAIARELAKVSSAADGIDPLQEDVVRTLATVSWLWAPRQRLEAFFLHADDRSGSAAVGTTLDPAREDPEDGRLTWFGLRAIGNREIGRFGTLEYWADWASLGGTATDVRYEDAGAQSRVRRLTTRKLRASALDLGLTWEAPLPASPSLTLSVARGSGDADPDDGVDRAFRQTGLHQNKWRYAGVNRFRVYGELLHPELSNLQVRTASLGVPLLRNSSIELAWHDYRQLHASDTLRDTRLNADPSGLDPDIGQEIDLVLGFREGRRLDVELATGMFMAGEAFANSGRRRAWFGQLEFTWNF